MGTPGHAGLTPPFSWILFIWADDTGVILTKIELLPSHSTVALIEEPTKEPMDLEDPWDLPELKPQGIKWSGKNEIGKGLSSPPLQYHLLSPLSCCPSNRGPGEGCHPTVQEA